MKGGKEWKHQWIQIGHELITVEDSFKGFVIRFFSIYKAEQKRLDINIQIFL